MTVLDHQSSWHPQQIKDGQYVGRYKIISENWGDYMKDGQKFFTKASLSVPTSGAQDMVWSRQRSKGQEYLKVWRNSYSDINLDYIYDGGDASYQFVTVIPSYLSSA